MTLNRKTTIKLENSDHHNLALFSFAQDKNNELWTIKMVQLTPLRLPPMGYPRYTKEKHKDSKKTLHHGLGV